MALDQIVPMGVPTYEGSLLGETGKPKQVRFYDEREWRFAPTGDSVGELGVLGYEEFHDPFRRAEANGTIPEKCVLPFEPSDIRYLVVASESEIVPLIKRLRKIKAKYGEDQILLLASRIISAEQIAEDF